MPEKTNLEELQEIAQDMTESHLFELLEYAEFLLAGDSESQDKTPPP